MHDREEGGDVYIRLQDLNLLHRPHYYQIASDLKTHQLRTGGKLPLFALGFAF